VQVARDLTELGFTLLATRGTAGVIKSHGIPVTEVNKVAEGRPHIVDMIKNGEVSFIVNTVEASRTAISDSRSIRTTALARRVTYYTTVAGAKAACAGMKHISRLEPYRLQDLHARLRLGTPEPVPT
jgi:carbamoyl-phosphate synthase large subunit